MSNTQPKYDSLEYASELKNVGFTDEQAKIQAKALFKVIDQQLVTKQNIKELEVKMSFDMKELETKLSYEIKELDAKLSREIKELDVKIKELEVKLTHEIQDVRRDIADVKRDVAEMGKDIFVKLGSLMASLFAVSGVLITILFKFVH